MRQVEHQDVVQRVIRGVRDEAERSWYVEKVSALRTLISWEKEMLVASG
jgi:hypothetical protein